MLHAMWGSMQPTAAEMASYMPVVQSVVHRFLGRLPPNVLREDLIAAGTYGLIDAFRKNPERKEGFDGAELLLELRHEQEALASAIESLPEREQKIVRMHYFEGVQFKAIAKELGVSEPRVSQLHTRAMTMLRERVAA